MMSYFKPKSKQNYNTLERLCDKLLKRAVLPLIAGIILIPIVSGAVNAYDKHQAKQELLVMHAQTFKNKREDILRELNGYLLTGDYDTIERIYAKLTLVEDAELEKIHAIAAKELTAILEHKEKVKQQFSKFDGSHYMLERYLKKHLKDPSSYDHIETRYSDQKDHLIVLTKYRAKNGFGAMTIGMIKAKISLDGSIIQILSSE